MKFKRIGRTLGLIGIVGMCLASAGGNVVLAYPSQGVPLYLDATEDGNNDPSTDPGKDTDTEKDSEPSKDTEADPKPKPIPSEGDDDKDKDKDKEKDKDKNKDKDKDHDSDKDSDGNPGGDKNNKPTPTIPEPVIPPPVIINPILPVPPVPVEEESEPLKKDDNKKRSAVRNRNTAEEEEESFEEWSEITEESEPVEEMEETEEAREPEKEELTESETEFETEITEEEPDKSDTMRKVAAAAAAVAVAVGSGGAIFFIIIYVKRPGLTGFYETEGLSVKYKDIYGKGTDFEYMVSADEIADRCSNTEEFIEGLRESGIRTILPVFSKAEVIVTYEDGDRDNLKVKTSDNSIYDAIEEAVDAGNAVEIRITNLRGNKRLRPVVFNRY